MFKKFSIDIFKEIGFVSRIVLHWLTFVRYLFICKALLHTVSGLKHAIPQGRSYDSHFTGKDSEAGGGHWCSGDRESSAMVEVTLNPDFLSPSPNAPNSLSFWYSRCISLYQGHVLGGLSRFFPKDTIFVHLYPKFPKDTFFSKDTIFYIGSQVSQNI